MHMCTYVLSRYSNAVRDISQVNLRTKSIFTSKHGVQINGACYQISEATIQLANVTSENKIVQHGFSYEFEMLLRTFGGRHSRRFWEYRVNLIHQDASTINKIVSAEIWEGLFYVHYVGFGWFLMRDEGNQLKLQIRKWRPDGNDVTEPNAEKII